MLDNKKDIEELQNAVRLVESKPDLKKETRIRDYLIDVLMKNLKKLEATNGK